jgi:hypothetical protein
MRIRPCGSITGGEQHGQDPAARGTDEDGGQRLERGDDSEHVG